MNKSFKKLAKDTALDNKNMYRFNYSFDTELYIKARVIGQRAIAVTLVEVARYGAVKRALAGGSRPPCHT